MLQIKNITYRIGERLLFENATLTVPNRHKVGIVGRNGSGKTTLFRLITGEIEPDSGSILFNQSHTAWQLVDFFGVYLYSNVTGTLRTMFTLNCSRAMFILFSK